METNEEYGTKGFYRGGNYKWTGGCGGMCYGYGTMVTAVTVANEQQ